MSRSPGAIITDFADKADEAFNFTLDGGKHKSVEGDFR
jgi:hypothetical protein